MLTSNLLFFMFHFLFPYSIIWIIYSVFTLHWFSVLLVDTLLGNSGSIIFNNYFLSWFFFILKNSTSFFFFFQNILFGIICEKKQSHLHLTIAKIQFARQKANSVLHSKRTGSKKIPSKRFFCPWMKFVRKHDGNWKTRCFEIHRVL